MPSYLEILRQHGETIDLDEYSMSNAIRLAEGALPIVVVMQEPCNLADDEPYEVMMYGDSSSGEWSQRRIGCPALQEVEILVETLSGGRYDLDDISLFDLNTLLSQDIQRKMAPEDLEAALAAAHHTFWRMVLAKSPDVIDVLTCAAGGSEKNCVRLLWSSLKEAGSMQEITLHNGRGSRKATVLRGFHPSTYLRDDYVEEGSWSSEKTRAASKVIRLCFAKAFTVLDNESAADNDDERKVIELWKAYTTQDAGVKALTEHMSEQLSMS